MTTSIKVMVLVMVLSSLNASPSSPQIVLPVIEALDPKRFMSTKEQIEERNRWFNQVQEESKEHVALCKKYGCSYKGDSYQDLLDRIEALEAQM